ncbi:hypothetical protein METBISCDRAFT_20904 [Metschnikowia bicuspidata]|uniref:EKC/KEOPS complex subunit BUD32 n=1 Tax=Metschnikowia bicuspidata TaxID=27322 RepID=A0A4P9ZKP5_9ASCO|nr:hypothetical protein METBISCDRAFT_20904 [Metschnikowia bicuspidata]
MTDAILSQLDQLVPHVPLTVVSQGAEALVLSTLCHPYLSSEGSYIIKYRPPKPYRHPRIDAQITKSRTVGEAKFMAKLRRAGIRCPVLVLLDPVKGLIWMKSVGEKLPNGAFSSLKNTFWYLEKTRDTVVDAEAQIKHACCQTGALIGHLHMNDMVHGDLTTSNVLMERGEAVLIDFGLSLHSALLEDKAVDLYVLERAVLSTHSLHAEAYNQWLLEGYKREQCGAFASLGGKKKYNETMKKLEDVRLRGRKRSMLG